MTETPPLIAKLAEQEAEQRAAAQASRLAGNLINRDGPDAIRQVISSLRDHASACVVLRNPSVTVTVTDETHRVPQKFHNISVMGGCPAKQAYANIFSDNDRLTCTDPQTGKETHFDLYVVVDDDHSSPPRVVFVSRQTGNILDAAGVAGEILEPMLRRVWQSLP